MEKMKVSFKDIDLFKAGFTVHVFQNHTSFFMFLCEIYFLIK
jgi:hypothetical protein